MLFLVLYLKLCNTNFQYFIIIADLQPRASEPCPRTSRKREVEEESEADSEDDLGTREELVLAQSAFKPLYLISSWRETFTTRQCLSAAILLPSGIDTYKIRVVDDGMMLQLTVTWPKAMTDIRMLHHYWLVLQNSNTISEQHPKIGGFEECLRKRRPTMDDDVLSVANIPLPCAVETTIEEEPLWWEDSGVRIVYVDMKSALDAYSSAQPTKRFKSMTNKAAQEAIATGSTSGIAASQIGDDENDNSMQ